jgi:hypothetical protein
LKLTGEPYTGLVLEMLGSQHEMPGFSYVGFASLPLEPELSIVEPT